MKILLVLPAAEHLRVTASRPFIPKRAMLRFSILPLLVVAGLTPREHEVEICDENVQHLDFDKDVDVVGVSFMTALANRAYEIARTFRSRGRIVVAGGYHPTLCFEEVKRHFDCVVRGDAEGAWQEVIRDIGKGSLKKEYCGAAAGDLSAAPVPRRDLIEDTADLYATTNAVQTGRGCVHRCRYCSIASFYQGRHRSRPVDHVMEELRALPRDFIFVDDNIVADSEYARSLFKAMIPLKKRWVSQCSLKIADDPELLDLAYRSGCRGLFIGIETLSRDNLASVAKEFNAQREIKERIAAIQGKGIGIVAGMIVGMDHDDAGVFERMLRFLQQTGISALQLNIMTPLPGTPLYADFEQAGRILDHDWSRYDFRHAVIRPARMSPRALQDGADWLYRQYYRLDRIIVRTLRTLFTSGWIPAILAWRLNMTYRYDNKRESIRGRNPARKKRSFIDRFRIQWRRGYRSAALIPGRFAR
ncbi:MAG: B12-binding domain-containing radical SAM protein [Planctomycetota bacterium]|jgi:radical SAM superfamily enzyme YgiQ (UPF0313 family)